MENDLTSVESLLKLGVTPNLWRGGDEKTPLILASQHGYENIVKMLLDAGADVNEKDIDDRTALILTSRPGNENIVKMLLAAGADVNAENKNKSSALLEAVGFRSENIIQELIISGADINAQNYDGNTALMLALQSYLNIGGVDDDISIILTILKL